MHLHCSQYLISVQWATKLACESPDPLSGCFLEHPFMEYLLLVEEEMFLTQVHNILHSDTTIIVGIHLLNQSNHAHSWDLSRAVDQAVVFLWHD
jgi:hypothetical protein